MTEISVRAYAKINLFLDIAGRRSDGYHELNNIMQKISLHDRVSVFISEGENEITVSCDNPDIPRDERNIAYRAAEKYLNAAGLTAKIHIEIKKDIPVMAGLGGSSADGAAVLYALDKHFGKLTASEVQGLAAGLGADVPFCLWGKAAFCKGIGEIMTETEPLPKCTILIVKPDFSCSTSMGYGLYDKQPIECRGEPDKLLKALKSENIKCIGENLYNIFEPLYGDKRIEKIKEELMLCGAAGALLSGSGSAVYGIFSDEAKAAAAYEKINYPSKITANPIFTLEKN